ncbi:MAG: hypothetical protein GY873_39160 [Bosea sp.]|uniref:hypothetical protein n=1 Tax=Bosea sp. (in: a-proteobacteria) TaxID=1871050 RepID=UPI00238765EC|nr:hypothetical protein [Bosea sp. (in: a-proteobacteria)]MCP4740224.1 hypothetical protein [Bosea sp. (in: a-proteobacteria)]
MSHFLITYDTNRLQSEFATALAADGWDDHYTNVAGEDRRLPNTTMQSKKFSTSSAAITSVNAARDKVRTEHDKKFSITHFAIAQFLHASGGALRPKVKKVKAEITTSKVLARLKMKED